MSSEIITIKKEILLSVDKLLEEKNSWVELKEKVVLICKVFDRLVIALEFFYPEDKESIHDVRNAYTALIGYATFNEIGIDLSSSLLRALESIKERSFFLDPTIIQG